MTKLRSRLAALFADDLLKHSALLFAGMMAAHIFNLLYQMAVSRALPKKEYALLAAFLGVLTILARPLSTLTTGVSHYSSLQPQGLTLVFGDSLITWTGFHSFFPGGSDLVALHPLGWAAYFGFLATSLNLLPIGQLDGGHIVYAIFGPRGHRIISRVFFVLLIAVSLLSFPSYLVFALVLLFIRLKHPPTIHDEIKIRGYRRILAIVALIIFCLTFIPIPFQIKQF